MDLLKETISGAAGAIVGTAILTLIALLWRRWLIRRYNLTEAARRVLEALWDENLLRRAPQIALEIKLEPGNVESALNELEKKSLARKRDRANGIFWKITLRGKQYLEQLSWLGELG